MIMEDAIVKLREITDRSRRIVFFGGAGVSTASGIPDFRSSDGIYSGKWKDREPEEVLSSAYFALHTEDFYDFYRKYMLHPGAEPNIVHRWLYGLEKEDRLRGIVTQNIDGLHRAAGNKRVYELHGNVHENYCIDCDASYPLDKILSSSGVPRCDRCGGIIKPWVVLYGESPDRYTCIGAEREITGADTLIVAGTSLQVEPAASFIGYFGGKNLVVINREPGPADDKADLVIHGDIAEVIKTAYF